jgi:hypothetical protein
MLTNHFKLDFLSNHQGIIIVVKQIGELVEGDAAHLELFSTNKAEFYKCGARHHTNCWRQLRPGRIE